ncbi:MAG: hypothetical protein M0Z28_09170 [Rhodospirillales bacterium]|nr:hypothetical protein [Rhodospirillales bacterium]
MSPELALNFSGGSNRSHSKSRNAFDAAHARLAQEFAAVEEGTRPSRANLQPKPRSQAAGANLTLLSLGWYLGAARMKLRQHAAPPKTPTTAEKDHFWSIEAPIIALALIHEFGSEAHTRASHRADGAIRAGDIIAARQWRRIAQIIRHEQATTTGLRASTPSSQSGSPQRSLGRWRASPASLSTGREFREA